MTCNLCKGRGVIAKGPKTLPCPNGCKDIAYRGGEYNPGNVDWSKGEAKKEASDD